MTPSEPGRVAGRVGGRVAGRVAVVTGAAGGLGQTFCAALAAEGAAVVGVDVADQTATRDRVEAKGATFVPVTADVTDEADCARLAEQTQGYGGAHIVVNNAGTYPVVPFLDTSLEEWRRIHSLNVEGTFLVTRALLPQLLESGWGRVVMIASAAVLVGPPGMVAYTASKGALVGMTRALASEVGDRGVTVNVITPGLTRTDTALATAVNEQFPHVVGTQAVPRAEEAEDVVSALLFVCDAGSAMLTGQTINVDGGSAYH